MFGDLRVLCKAYCRLYKMHPETFADLTIGQIETLLPDEAEKAVMEHAAQPIRARQVLDVLTRLQRAHPGRESFSPGEINQETLRMFAEENDNGRHEQ
jgi:hypothetical protein